MAHDLVAADFYRVSCGNEGDEMLTATLEDAVAQIRSLNLPVSEPGKVSAW
jgi:hypothetical protein